MLNLIGRQNFCFDSSDFLGTRFVFKNNLGNADGNAAQSETVDLFAGFDFESLKGDVITVADTMPELSEPIEPDYTADFGKRTDMIVDAIVNAAMEVNASNQRLSQIDQMGEQLNEMKEDWENTIDV